MEVHAHAMATEEADPFFFFFTEIALWILKSKRVKEMRLLWPISEGGFLFLLVEGQFVSLKHKRAENSTQDKTRQNTTQRNAPQH